MLLYVEEHPRWPGVCARGGNLHDGNMPPNNGELFAKMDKEINEREVAYWKRQVQVYKDAKVGT